MANVICVDFLVQQKYFMINLFKNRFLKKQFSGLLEKDSPLRQSGIYFAGAFLEKAFPFLALPFLTSRLSPTEWGLWALFATLNAIVFPIIGLGSKFHIVRNFFEVSQEDTAQDVWHIVVINFVIAIALSLVLGGMIYAGQKQLFGLDLWVLLLIPVMGWLSCIRALYTLLLQFEKKPVLYTIYKSAPGISAIILAVIILAYSNTGWTAMLLATLLTNLIASVLCFVQMAKSYPLRNMTMKLPLAWEIIVVNGPAIPHVIGASLLSMMDRLMLESYASVKDVGIYAIGYTIGNVVALLISVNSKVWGVWIYEKLGQMTEALKYRVIGISYLIIGIMALAALFVIFAGSLYIKFLLDPAYHGAVDVLFWISLSSIAAAIYSINFHYLNYLKKTWVFSFITVVALGLNFILNIWLIPKLGYEGAAIATMITSVLQTLVIFCFNQKYYPMPWLAFWPYILRKIRRP